MAKRRLELTVDALGGQGDGIAAASDGRRVYVPYALPGERVEVEISHHARGAAFADLLSVEECSADRIQPVCPHFGHCGGCALQHLAPEPYGAWQRDKLVQALARRGITAPPLEELVPLAPGTRRRLRLAARRTAAGVVLGYNERASRRIVAIESCAVAKAELVALLAPLKSLLEELPLASAALDVVVTVADNGIDLWLVSAEAIALGARERLAAFAQAQDLARLSWGPDGAAEEVVVRRPPVVSFSGLPVALPVGAFVQATQASETLLTAFAAEALAPARKVADLFAGLGAFALGLPRSLAVHALDVDPEAMAALAASGVVTTEVRDLFRRPLSALELAPYDGVVFDPPRAGAAAQAAEIAASEVRVVVAISCHPGTFARDARILLDGGYRLERVLPVDQFLWSPHVELAAVLRK